MRQCCIEDTGEGDRQGAICRASSEESHVKLFKTTIVAVAVGAALAPAANAQLSANIGAVSNYVWRGATQTDDGPAIQGGVDFAHESGFFIGTWVSNVDFDVPEGDEVLPVLDANGNPTGDVVVVPGGDNPEVEVDLYAGYGGKVGDFAFKGGLYYYMYPDSDDVNFLELGVSGTYSYFTLGLNYTLDGEASGDAPFQEGDIYYYGAVNIPLPQDFSVGLTVGYYDFDKDWYEDSDGDIGSGDYTHYLLTLSKSAGDWGTFSLNVSFADEEANGGDDDPKVFVGWLKTF
jgi:uncharacterized protein (TIGR02001 family)